MGKLAFILVLGFSVLFLVMGYNANNVATRSVQNMVDYHARTVAYNIAVSAANLAANEIFLNDNWDNGYSNRAFDGGYLDADVVVLDPILNIRKLTTTGTYRGVTKTVEVIFKPSSFSKFAYFSTNDPGNLYWSYKDTIWGPFHSEGKINAYRHPVFHGKATTKLGVHNYQSEALDAPRFYGGFESGVSLDFPESGIEDLEDLAESGGHLFEDQDTVYITFAGDSLKYRYAANDPDITVFAQSFAPNGVIFVNNGTMRIKGTVKGRYTIGCTGTGNDGSIYLDDDIVYYNDPRIDPSSTDILGIVTKNDVKIADNLANSSDINIHASIYAEKGGFGAGWSSFTQPNGFINLYGGIQNRRRVQIGIIVGGDIWGFNRRYKYDERLMIMSPPGYPAEAGLSRRRRRGLWAGLAGLYLGHVSRGDLVTPCRRLFFAGRGLLVRPRNTERLRGTRSLYRRTLFAGCRNSSRRRDFERCERG
ncbi:MAG: hypothetical protein IH784_07675 [Bacteroidetes bacterium]|nr:hypothetical protein [Bacteroidota bacterium]